MYNAAIHVLYLPYRPDSIHVVISSRAKASVNEDMNTCFITPVPFVNSYLSSTDQIIFMHLTLCR